MLKTMKHTAPWVAGTALAVVLSACGTPAEEQPPVPDSLEPSASASESMPPEAVETEASVLPINPPEDPGTEQTFDGDGVTTDTITANEMEMEIPFGLRIPADTLVTEAKPASIMMAEEDPAAVIAEVESSADEAGYETYAETTRGKVYVGNGNAVLFEAGPQAQLITWGPEEMKDVLAET